MCRPNFRAVSLRERIASPARNILEMGSGIHEIHLDGIRRDAFPPTNLSFAGVKRAKTFQRRLDRTKRSPRPLYGALAEPIESRTDPGSGSGPRWGRNQSLNQRQSCTLARRASTGRVRSMAPLNAAANPRPFAASNNSTAGNANGRGLAAAFSGAIEHTRPVEARLARVHDCLWSRLWFRPQRGALPEPGSVRDLIGSASAP